MKKLTFAIALLLCFQMMNGQSKNVDSFNSIEISGNISAELIQSNDERVEYEVTKGDAKNLIITNKENSLIVKTKGDWYKGSKTAAKVKIYYKAIVGLEVSSGSSVSAVDMIEADKFDFEVSSGSTCNMKVRSDFLDLEVSSGSTLTLDGRSDTADIEVSSGSSLRGMDFVIENVDVEVSSGSTAQFGVTNTLIGGVSSGSTLKYSGEPSKVDVDKDISSSVSKR